MIGSARLEQGAVNLTQRICGAKLVRANLSGAQPVQRQLGHADLTSATLTGADLSGAD